MIKDMIKNIKIKDKKGISLASVLVTLVLMIIILTSIVYSNGRSKEIKEAMLINSDIEELTKKVEVYYLEKETLPTVNDNFKYIEILDVDGETVEVYYYRLQISLLENITLNNKEIIQNQNIVEPSNGDQWYVINPETHTIYLIKRENDENVLQTAKYSENYKEILELAKNNNINFSIDNVTGDSPSIENTELIPGIDYPIDDSTSIDIGNINGDGTNKTPDEIAGEGIQYDVYDYVGYSKNWVAGEKSDSMMIHYDGEYNKLDATNKILIYNDTSNTWSDLSGNGNDARIVENATWGFRWSEGKANGTYKIDNRTAAITMDSVWENDKSLNLNSDEYVLCDFIKTNNMTGKAELKSNCLNGTGKEYTIEIVYADNDEYRRIDNLFGTGMDISELQRFAGMLTGNSSEGSLTNKGISFEHGWTSHYDDNYGDYVHYFDFCCSSTHLSESSAKNCKTYDTYKNNILNAFNPIPEYYKNIYRDIFNDDNINMPLQIEFQTMIQKNSIVNYDLLYKGALTWVYDIEEPNRYLKFYSYSSNKFTNAEEKSVGFYDKDFKSGSFAVSDINTISYKYESGKRSLYYNGDINNPVEIESDISLIVPEITLGAQEYNISGYNTTDGYTFTYQYKNLHNGKIYSLRIYNRPLKEEEIAQNYFIDKIRFGSGI